MAEFCRQCSIDIFGEDFRDLAGITAPELWDQGLAASVICEGCGCIQVDPQGNCVTADCLRAGHAGHGMPWLTVREK